MSLHGIDRPVSCEPYAFICSAHFDLRILYFYAPLDLIDQLLKQMARFSAVLLVLPHESLDVLVQVLIQLPIVYKRARVVVRRVSQKQRRVIFRKIRRFRVARATILVP